MQKLAGTNVSRVIDLLKERLTFERSGVKLYDKILERMRNDPQAAPMVEQMQEHRDEEKEHEEWLEEQIRALGGDARSPSEKYCHVAPTSRPRRRRRLRRPAQRRKRPSAPQRPRSRRSPARPATAARLPLCWNS